MKEYGMAKNMLKVLVAGMLTTGLVACSGGGDSAPSTESDLVISGTLGASLSQGLSSKVIQNDVGSLTSSFSDLEFYVFAFTTPPTAAVANIASDGSFSASLPGAKGAQIMAVFQDKTSKSRVGVVKFRDTSKKDMDGSDLKSESIALSGNVTLGTIAMQDGEVVVDVQDLGTAVDTTPPPVSSAMDMGGNWTITAYDGTLPTGYSTACATQSESCHGPLVNENVFLISLKGVELDSQNNPTTTPVYALSFWRDAASVNSCGNVTGFTDAEAKTAARVALTMPVQYSLNGTPTDFNFGDTFTFQTPSNFGGDTCSSTGNGICNLPWMKTGAQSTYEMHDCKDVILNGTKVSACLNKKASNPDIYSAHVHGGGCVDAAGKAIRFENYSLAPTSCNNTPVTGMTGFYSNRCDYDGAPVVGAASQTFTCTWSYGHFSDAALQNALAENVDMSGYSPSVTAIGTACKDIVDDLNRYRCYANNYWSTNPEGNGCYQRYDFNWSAQDVANFVMTSGRDKPDANYMTEKVTYSPDGQTGVVSSKERTPITIRTDKTDVICDVERSELLSFKKVTDAKVLVDMKTSMRLVNSSNPVCLAFAGKTSCDSGGGDNCELYFRLKENGNTLFYLNK